MRHQFAGSRKLTLAAHPSARPQPVTKRINRSNPSRTNPCPAILTYLQFFVPPRLRLVRPAARPADFVTSPPGEANEVTKSVGRAAGRTRCKRAKDDEPLGYHARSRAQERLRPAQTTR